MHRHHARDEQRWASRERDVELCHDPGVAEPLIGRRVATYRRRRGLSQAAVAGLVGRSESWLSQVERGLRDVDSYRVLRDLARVLRVDVDALTGCPPIGGADASVGVDEALAAVERALLLGALPAVPELGGAVRAAHRDYQAAGYEEVLGRLPGLVGALGDVPGAIAAASVVDLDHLPSELRSRRVQVQLDLAWAQTQRRRDADALVALLEVERAAPQVTRRNVVARDTIRQLLARTRGSTAPAVRSLADRAGITV